MPAPIKVLIADHHPIVRYGLRHLLDAETDIRVIGEAGTAPELTDQFQTLAPDVIISDLEIVKTGHLEALRAFRASAQLIVCAALKDIRHIAKAVELEAHIHLLKDCTSQELVRLIRSVYEGATLLEPAVASSLLQHMRYGFGPGRRVGDALSPRQREVLRLLAAGRTNRSIADQLCISERTVKFHVSTILNQLQARNRVEAVLMAAESGLVQLGHVPERRRRSPTEI